MKHWLVALCLSVPVSGFAISLERRNVDTVMRQSTLVFDEIMSQNDLGIARSILGKATCIVVLPKYGGFDLFGGVNHGKGPAICRTAPNYAWSKPVFVRFNTYSVGFNFGLNDAPTVLILSGKRAAELIINKGRLLGGRANAGVVDQGGGVFGGSDLNGTTSAAYSKQDLASIGASGSYSDFGYSESFLEPLYGRQYDVGQLLATPFDPADPTMSKAIYDFIATVREFAGDSPLPARGTANTYAPQTSDNGYAQQNPNGPIRLTPQQTMPDGAPIPNAAPRSTITVTPLPQ